LPLYSDAVDASTACVRVTALPGLASLPLELIQWVVLLDLVAKRTVFMHGTAAANVRVSSLEHGVDLLFGIGMPLTRDIDVLRPLPLPELALAARPLAPAHAAHIAMTETTADAPAPSSQSSAQLPAAPFTVQVTAGAMPALAPADLDLVVAVANRIKVPGAIPAPRLATPDRGPSGSKRTRAHVSATSISAAVGSSGNAPRARRAPSTPWSSFDPLFGRHLLHPPSLLADLADERGEAAPDLPAAALTHIAADAWPMLSAPTRALALAWSIPVVASVSMPAHFASGLHLRDLCSIFGSVPDMDRIQLDHARMCLTPAAAAVQLRLDDSGRPARKPAATSTADLPSPGWCVSSPAAGLVSSAASAQGGVVLAPGLGSREPKFEELLLRVCARLFPPANPAAAPVAMVDDEPVVQVVEAVEAEAPAPPSPKVAPKKRRINRR
jgi:hypothetical protein